MPPRNVWISSSAVSEASIEGPLVGPVVEGGTLRLTCHSDGGYPPPTVTWWDGDRPLDGHQPSLTPAAKRPSYSDKPEQRKSINIPTEDYTRRRNVRSSKIISGNHVDMNFLPYSYELLESRNLLGNASRIYNASECARIRALCCDGEFSTQLPAREAEFSQQNIFETRSHIHVRHFRRLKSALRSICYWFCLASCCEKQMVNKLETNSSGVVGEKYRRRNYSIADDLAITEHPHSANGWEHHFHINLTNKYSTKNKRHTNDRHLHVFSNKNSNKIKKNKKYAAAEEHFNFTRTGDSIFGKPENNLYSREQKDSTPRLLQRSAVVRPFDKRQRMSYETEKGSDRLFAPISANRVSTSAEEKNGVITNSLIVEALGREDLLRLIICRASNSNLTRPIEKGVRVDMIRE